MSKRLVVCCDGTWNRPDELKGGVPCATNVFKLSLGLAREDPDGVEQRLLYQQGVGTKRFERIRGGAFGVGLGRNVRACYRFIVETYEPGDELWFFGFSRGAFTARSVAGLVRNCGVLRREHVDRIGDGWRLYRNRNATAHPSGMQAQIFRRMYAHPDADVHFIGVWDTVGSLGIPIDGLHIPLVERWWGFHDTALSSRVTNAFHALSIDEQRKQFRPTLWKQQPDHKPEQRLEQAWFAGAHSDVGGGYPEPDLSEVALLWMVDRARECGLHFDHKYFTEKDGPIDPHVRQSGREIAPDPLGPLHDSRKGFFKLLGRHERVLDDTEGSYLFVDRTAQRRHDEMPEYGPPNLGSYLGADLPLYPPE